MLDLPWSKPEKRSRAENISSPLRSASRNTAYLRRYVSAMGVRLERYTSSSGSGGERGDFAQRRGARVFARIDLGESTDAASDVAQSDWFRMLVFSVILAAQQPSEIVQAFHKADGPVPDYFDSPAYREGRSHTNTHLITPPTPRIIPPHDRITIDATICHGDPVIRGTRIPVRIVIGSLAAGMTQAEGQRDYAPYC